MSYVGLEADKVPHRRHELGSDRSVDTGDLGARVTHQMDVLTFLQGMEYRGPMADVGVGYQTYVLQHLERAVDR